jgi:predicted DNA-binding protein
MARGSVGGVNKTTLSLPDELHERLRAHARRTGQRQADIVRVALDRFLADEAARAPASIGAGQDENLSGSDSEAWLRANRQPR